MLKNISIAEVITYNEYGKPISGGCRGDNIVAIDFYRRDCMPCVKNLLPLLEVVSKERTDIDWYKLEKPYGVNMMEIFGLSGYPTIIFYRNGKEFARYNGYSTDEHFRNFLETVK